MRRQLYFECSSGISGDMAVGAMLDLGADPSVLKAALDSLPLSGYRAVIGRRPCSGIDACDFDVKLEAPYETHDHDMAYLYGPDDPDEAHHEHHHHDHDHEHHHHHHSHRTLAEVKAILAGAELSDGARALANRIFDHLAAAEAKAHGTDADHVHFHEVGAVDSIVDITAAAVCFDDLKTRLGFSGVLFPAITEGCGKVRCAHGWMPVPVPAVVHLAEQHHLPIKLTDLMGERVTPTGAAIASAVMTGQKLPDTFTIVKSGVGAGKRTYTDCTNILRVFLIEDKDDDDSVVQIEANLDDSTGEILGRTMDRLLAAGALDVTFTPVVMKKNRPGTVLTVLCKAGDAAALEDLIFAETTTIGLRHFPVRRAVLPRRIETVETPWGQAKVKVTEHQGKTRGIPEYDAVAALADANNLAFPDVYAAVIAAWQAKA
jgi:uncharacterized protein (TIGR00299 family) protein